MSDSDIAKARIRVKVYLSDDGIRWRITSAARGRRVISESSEAYAHKADAFRGLLLTTGGRYVQTFRLFPTYYGGVYEQGSILRRTPEGLIEDVFVEYDTHKKDAR